MTVEKEIAAIGEIIKAIKDLSHEEALRALEYAERWASSEIKHDKN